MRKPVFGAFTIMLDSNWPAQQQNFAGNIEILDLASIGIILCKLRTTKAPIQTPPLLFAYGINRFSHDMAHKIQILCYIRFQ